MELLNHLIKKGFFLLPFLLLYGGELSFYNPFEKNSIKFQNTSYSDFGSVYDLFHDWKTLYTKTNTNIAYQDTSLQIQKEIRDNYYIGYFKKYEYFLQTNSDTVLFVYQILNKQDLISDKQYNLDLSLKGFSSDSLFISKNINYTNLQFNISLFLHRLSDFQDGWVRGRGIIYNDNDYDYYVNSEYYYNHNYLYELDVKKAYGYGYSSSISFKYKKEKISFICITNDLISYIHIKNAPYSNVTINTSNKKIDENGHVTYTPTIYGLETYKDYNFKLMPKIRNELAYKNKYIIGDDYFMGYNFPYIGYIINGYKINYGFRFKDIGVSGNIKNFQFQIGLNNISIRKSSYLKLNMGYYYKF